MSLNGLDDSAVVDAYQAALAEAGGWQVASISARMGVKADIFSGLQVPSQTCDSRHGRVARQRYCRRWRGEASDREIRREISFIRTRAVPAEEGRSQICTRRDFQASARFAILQRMIRTPVNQVFTQPALPSSFNRSSRLSRPTKRFSRSRKPPS